MLSDLVATLVEILVDVLHRSKKKSTFKINVAVHPQNAKWIEGHNPAIVKYSTSDLECLSIIAVTIARIGMLIHGGEGLKCFWIPSRACAVFHAWCMRVKCSTGAMDHNFFTAEKRCGCSSGSGHSAEMMESMTSGDCNLYSRLRMIKRCMWGRPRF